MLGLPYDIQEIAQAALAKDLHQGSWPLTKLRYVAFDTRLITHGEETLFVAIKSTHRDGHAYVQAALDKGVRNFLVEQPVDAEGINYALCENTLDALQAWAMFHRRRFSYPVVGITGSNGKTIVKEWVSTLIEAERQLVKSPMSYNSQLGVPISVLRMHPQADCALIEAGISQPGEMAFLHQIIQPTLGVMTHFGTAHQEGFASEETKLQEKLQLFEGVKKVLAGSGQPEVLSALEALGLSLQTIGTRKEDNVQVDFAGEHIFLERVVESWELGAKPASPADQENLLLSLLVAHELGVSWESLRGRIPLLLPVEMRSELLTDNPEITLINDSYNSDPDSVRNAFGMLMQTRNQPHRHIILSDLPHLGELQVSTQQGLLQEAIELVGRECVRTVGPVFHQIGGSRSYPNTESLLAELRYEEFVDSTVLIKGARSFALERLIPRLTRKLNATEFDISLQALRNNFRFLQSQVPTGTKAMCMVKAFAYGSGGWEIAQTLEQVGADYLAVAFASEAIELRQANIRLPIMVMNPDLSSIEALIRYQIEPEVSNVSFLRQYLRAAKLAGLAPIPLHLKLETGMGRLGFKEEDLPQLVELFLQQPDLQVVSVLSHLAAADLPEEDAFSQQQIQRFQAMYTHLHQQLGIVPMRHILNTAGLLRFPQASVEMVRMGIGLYGVHPLGQASELEEIGSLRSLISQIQTHPVGSSIGYGRSQRTERESRIATVPVGYADGIPRNLSNGKIGCLVRGKRAPVVGRVCMDMLMLDVTDIPEAEAGEEVVLFGRQGEAFLSVQEVAEAAGTIPYEILVRISPRVRRVYVRE
ncbi:MAG: bifunctional UDP-N-acetylmuramoyl-tripeptide:D-alanyl-D-alanine ligase/alanine racemase [Bacteroidota bacterium]